MVHRSGQCIARAGWEATQGLLDGGLPVRPLHEPVHHLLERRWPQPGKHPTPTTQAQPPGAGLTSCINPSPDMTTSASQRLRSSARTSSRAWFRRSAERPARLSRRGLGWGVGGGGVPVWGCSLHPRGETLTSERQREGDIGLGQQGLHVAPEELQGFALAPARI